MKNYTAVRVVGSGPEALADLVTLFVANMYGSGITRIGQRDAREDDPLGMSADIAEHGTVKVFQLGEGPQIPVALDPPAVAAMAVAWLAKLTRSDYPKGRGSHDSYEQGWLLMSSWGEIELAPVWIGISK